MFSVRGFFFASPPQRRASGPASPAGVPSGWSQYTKHLDRNRRLADIVSVEKHRVYPVFSPYSATVSDRVVRFDGKSGWKAPPKALLQRS